MKKKRIFATSIPILVLFERLKTVHDYDEKDVYY